MKRISFLITFFPDDPELTFTLDKNNFYPDYFIGLDGLLYKNYGTEQNPRWDSVIDEYNIKLLIN